ncbi:YeiH family protein [Pseudoxanthomonas sp. X-1]|uniref:YeiH family protein n=1 Tax=Pseudoxanthomonas sp. X-1 TaxID=2571115 RepID=UPI00110AC55F|nr:YeiH family protein [Pseudoxanthomonas sp. X-1]TMN16984.1 YeiH family putative sulfate export transporter [Pseudoxanthomonas sp. X-1]UAY75003.1 YeiH family protein [Pseudoxanthomonas sp. X-1]
MSGSTLPRPFALDHRSGPWPGLLLVLGIALAAIGLAQVPWMQGAGLSALTLAIVLGIALGNSVFPAIATRTGAGVDLAKGTLLRAGIVLYGLRVTFQDLMGVGVAGLAIDVAVVAGVFVAGTWWGMRVLRLDRQSAMLISAGSAICGAAAVLATEPVLRAPAHKVSVAVATVVVFGTLSMFVYPQLAPHLPLDAHAYGLYAGSTIHEVAQVVVAGRAVGEAAANAAVIEKMLRVMLLAPFLLALGAWLRRGRPRAETGATPLTIPWFALGFVAVAGFNSLHLLPARVVAVANALDTLLLAMAMAALGLRTHWGAIRQAGARPLLLAAVLWGLLMVGGYALNRGMLLLLA